MFINTLRCTIGLAIAVFIDAERCASALHVSGWMRGISVECFYRYGLTVLRRPIVSDIMFFTENLVPVFVDAAWFAVCPLVSSRTPGARGAGYPTVQRHLGGHARGYV